MNTRQKACRACCPARTRRERANCRLADGQCANASKIQQGWTGTQSNGNRAKSAFQGLTLMRARVARQTGRMGGKQAINERRAGMKVYVYMKDPDTMRDAVEEAVKADVKKLGLEGDEAEAIIEMRVQSECEKLARWFKYGEYLGVDFDTEAMTATVRART